MSRRRRRFVETETTKMGLAGREENKEEERESLREGLGFWVRV